MMLPSCLILLSALFAAAAPASRPVTLGDDALLGKEFALVAGKTVGVVTNQSGRLANGVFLIDTLRARGVKVAAIFAPEHGFRGEGAAGEEIKDGVDARTGIRVYSLYGDVTKPTPSMLRGIQVLVYDIQDVGARFYTYLSTMTLCMEAAGDAHIPFVVCDRPDPLGGLTIDGPVTEDSLRSFVGMHPIPVIYGLTCGELAALVNGEGWLARGVRADLHVVKLRGWTRNMKWEQTGLPWVPPSPNIRTPEAALVYPGTVYFEATNISEGRGTDRPFLTIGAPFVNRFELWSAMTGLNLPGVRFTTEMFTPSSSKFEEQRCAGIGIVVTDSAVYDPLSVGMNLLMTLGSLYPRDIQLREKALGRLVGDAVTVRSLLHREPYDVIRQRWQHGLDHFLSISARYRIYPER